MNVIIGFISGIISGMGIGGGSILIPALVLFANANQHSAQTVNLYYFIPTATVSLIVHFKNKSIHLKTAILMASFGIIGAILGAYIALSLSQGFLKKLFALFLFIVGVMELFNARKK